jgi:hypothetical protein
MLEKAVLVSSSLFCVATEIGFLVRECKRLGYSESQLPFTKKDSESYHAKALHFALLFLPDGSPLADHIEETYV